jgi:hypothetical protein
MDSKTVGTKKSAEKVTDKPTDIAPATTIDPSGAPVQIVPDVDMDHPAVDANPRSNTTENQNRIDFNDPSLDGREVVEKALADQAKD